MGGSGSGGYDPPRPASSCERLGFQAAVNSPQKDVLSVLDVGDVLDVVPSAPGPGVSVEYNGRIAGSLTGSHIAQLVTCMQSGFEYKATVVKLNGGQCVVRVEAR